MCARNFFMRLSKIVLILVSTATRYERQSCTKYSYGAVSCGKRFYKNRKLCKKYDILFQYCMGGTPRCVKILRCI